MFPLHSRLQLHSSGFFPGEQGSKYKAICICTYERMALGWLTFLPVAAFRKQALRTNDGYGFNRNTRIRSKAEYGRPYFSTSVDLRVVQVTVSLQRIRNSRAANEILFLNEVDAQLEIPAEAITLQFTKASNARPGKMCCHQSGQIVNVYS